VLPQLPLKFDHFPNSAVLFEQFAALNCIRRALRAHAPVLQDAEVTPATRLSGGRRRQLTLVLQQDGEIVEARRRMGMLGSEHLLADRQRAFKEGPVRRNYFAQS
jgi:hypothetical protein